MNNRLDGHLRYYEIPSEVIEKYKIQLQPGWSLTDSEFRCASYKYPELKNFSIGRWGIYKGEPDTENTVKEELRQKFEQFGNIKDCTDPELDDTGDDPVIVDEGDEKDMENENNDDKEDKMNDKESKFCFMTLSAEKTLNSGLKNNATIVNSDKWNWLDTHYLRNAKYSNDDDGVDINEAMEDAVVHFESLLEYSKLETNDILNVFYYFDHICRDCKVCHTKAGKIIGDCREARNTFKSNRSSIEWREMNFLMHEFVKNSSIPLHIVEQYRNNGPIRGSQLYKLKWSENGYWSSKGGVWLNIKTDLPLQLHVLGGCIDVGQEITMDQSHRLASMLNEFVDILAFDPKVIGTCNVIQHKINTGDSPPVHLNPYIYAAPRREEINRQVRELIEAGIVVPSNSPWSSPVVLVDKKDGTKRMCVDMRRVNSLTKSDVYPLPSISIALSSMQGARFFTSLDLNSGYHQISIEEGSREKTAFITQDGLFEYRKMSFGLKTAPSCFARAMDIVLSGLKWSSVLVYLDDILIFSKDFDSHLGHIREVLQRLQTAGFTIKPTKCSLAMKSIKFLGHVIDQAGIKTDPNKVKGIKDFPRPQTLTQVRGFIGRASYYRKFIPYFSEVAEPLSRLTKKNVRFLWGPSQERAFNQLKHLLSSHPVLTHFDGSKPLEVRCDASFIGIGAELVQLEDLGWKLVANASRLLTEAEKAYITSEKECLAIVYATEKFAPYIHGLKFTVVTDHLSLKWLTEKTNLSPRLIRWALHLQKYDFDVIYRSGRLMKDADALSRSPVDPPESIIDNHDRYALASSKASDENEENNDLNLPELQREDPFFGPIYELLFKNEEVSDPISSSYFLQDGLLYFNDKYNRKSPRPLTCVPEKIIHELLYSFHDDMMSGHLGINKTKAKIKERYFWPDMDNIIELYVKSCLDCQTKKTPNLPKAGFLVPIKVGGPFEMWGLDILGPFPISDSGNNNIIVATEYMTRFAETAAVFKADKWNVAKFIDENIIFKHGAPLKILTDQGKVFSSNLCKQIYANHEIAHVRTSAYHPATNGLTERFNKTLAEMISQYTSERQTDWDKSLTYVTFAYNTSIQESTKFSPFMLTYAREPVLPVDVIMKRPSIGIPDVDQYINLRKNFIQKARHLALQHITESQIRNTKHYNKRHREANFEIGQLVLVHNPRRYKGKAEKLLHQFYGPYKILEQRGPVNFYVESIKYKYETFIVHVSRMKPFHDRKEIFNSSDDNSDTITYDIEGIECLVDDYNENTEIAIQNFDNEVKSPTILGTSESEDKELSSDNDTIIDDQWNDFVLDPEYATTPVPTRVNSPEFTPRRSNRIRRPIDRLGFVAKSTLSLILLLFLSTFADSSLTKMSPVLWRKSNKPVISGINNVLVTVKYDSPCEIFKESFFNGTSQNELHKWCTNAYIDDFIKPVRGFCNSTISKANNEIRFHREKRFIFEAFLLATIIITTFTTIGVSSASLVQSAKSKDEIEKAKEEQERLIQTQIDFENNQMKIKQILAKLQSEISEIGVAVVDLTNSLKNLREEIPKAMHVVSNLASKMLLNKDRLSDISRKWKNGIIDEKLLEVFNITLPCDCILSLAQPKDCVLDEIRGLITINFDVHSKRKKTSTMEADPFVLYVSKNESICAVKYNGPQTVVYDAARDCVTALHQITQSSRNLILMPGTATCQRNLPESIVKRYWKVDHCTEKDVIVDEEIIQIKTSEKYNYIYCFSLKINIYNRTLDCPEYVFAIPSNAAFSINTITYESTLVNLQNTLNLMPEWSQRINFHLMSQLHNLNLSEIAKQTRDDINQIRRHEFKTEDVSSFDSKIHLIYVTILIITIFGLTIYFRRKKIKNVNFNRVRSIEEQRQIHKEENEIETSENAEISDENTDFTPNIPPGKLKRTQKVLFLATILTIMSPTVDSSEQNYIVLTIKFKSPCEALDTNITSPSQIDWCQKQFYLSFQQPVKTFCKMNRDVMSFENELYQNKTLRTKRENNNNITDNGDVSQYVVSSIVSSLAILKEVTTTIGQKWQRNKIDQRLLENSQFRIELPHTLKLYKFKPLLCLADFHCANLILILKKNDRSVWYESYCLEFLLSVIIISTSIIICIGIRNYLHSRRLETSNFKIIYDRKLSESLIERNLPLPPFPVSTEV